MSLCIVNYITRDTWHPHGQERLKESLRLIGFKGELLLLDEVNFKCPSHRKTPYAFKLYALKEAMNRGHDTVLWVDASFWAIRNLDGLEEMIRDKGFLVQNSGYAVGQWTSDDCLKRMSLSREDAFKIYMFSGGFMGVDIRVNSDREFFKTFFSYAQQGYCFRGAWKNVNREVSSDSKVLGHRHDMSVGSILLHCHKRSISPNNTFFNYYNWWKKYRHVMDLSNVYFVCDGGPRKLPLQEIESI